MIVKIKRTGHARARYLLRRVKPFAQWKKELQPSPIDQAIYFLIVIGLEEIARNGEITEVTSIQRTKCPRRKKRS